MPGPFRVTEGRLAAAPGGSPLLTPGGAWYGGCVEKPWTISGDDLKAWAGRVEAAALLPTLVRRLLLATAPLTAVEVRADGGTRLAGWDGIVRAREESPFCPPGVSVWELSVGEKIRQKLDDDFDKRMAAPPPPIRPKETTYVAVTARRFPGKQRWAEEKRAKRRWADVRVVDADDLATWLEQAPAVAQWFAEGLGRPAEGTRDVESMLTAWSRRTTPPLPWRLVLAGPERERAHAGTLIEWLSRPPERPLLVRGETREEALLFAGAVLSTQPDAEAWLARAVVVESSDALRRALAAQTVEPMIVLAAFESADASRMATARPAHVLLVGDRRAPELRGSTMDLTPIPWPPMAGMLERAGFERPEVDRLVRDSGGSLSKLQGLCGYIELPDWAKSFPAPELFAFLLAGAWTPRNDADREALRQLGGEPNLVDQLCTELHRRGDVERVSEGWGPSVWRWKSLPVTWKQLGDRLTDSQLERFQEVVLDVLGALSPVYDLPIADRTYAPITGHVLPHSGALRQGLARSMVMLSQVTGPEGDASPRRRDRQVAASLIYRLLSHDRGWKAWASLAGLLPTLAEAAPDAFLDVIERSLDQGADGVIHLLVEEGGSIGPTPHVDLLWALEGLGWSPDPIMVRRVVLALARLAARDIETWTPGKVANRPSGSLAKILHVLVPQSRTSADDRLRILETLLDNDEVAHIGWSIGVGMLDTRRGGIMMPSRQPEFLWEPVEKLKDAPDEEIRRQRAGAVDRLLARVGNDVERWKELLEPLRFMPGTLALKVLDALEKTDAIRADRGAVIWSALREQVRGLSYRRDAVAPEVQGRLRSLYEALTPDDLVLKYAWLFTPKIHQIPDSVENDWRKEEELKRTLQLRALEELWQQPNRWDLLVELKQAAEAPDLIGRALAKTTFAANVEERFLSNPPEELKDGVMPAFFAERFQDQRESERAPWTGRLLRRLVTEQRFEEARLIALVLPNVALLWDLIDEIGDPLRIAYWTKVSGPYGGHHSPESWERAVENLLEAGNVLSALEAASSAGDKLSAATAVRVLERVRELPSGARLSSTYFPFSFRVEEVLKRIERDSTVDPGTRLNLELAFLADIDNPERAHRFLSSALGDNPSAFVHLIHVMYRREGEPPVVGDSEEAVHTRAAEVAYDILSAWKGYPGEGLNAEERESRLEAWATEVLDATKADGRGGPGTTHVAEVLARAPDGPDDLWPCLAARRLLQRNKYPELLDSLRIAQRNRRGVTTRAVGEGGVQERELADWYREASRRLLDEFPQTAILLDSLARAYDEEAAAWDERAQRPRIEHGGEREAPIYPVIPSPAELVPPSAPLSRLTIRGVGPAPELTLNLAPRLNLITGDNSLGKTFVLEVLWWCLTGSFTYPERMPRPEVKVRNGKVLKSKAAITAVAGSRTVTGTYSALNERWTTPGSGPLASGLAIYAHVNGGFSIWDPIRNGAPQDKGEADLSKGYTFSPKELWEGLFRRGSATPLCNGLITDAVRWRSERPKAYSLLEAALTRLSPPHERLQFSLPKRLSVRGDARPHPVLHLPYGPVFAVHASAAVQRVLGLAYALVWAVSEIREAAPVADREPIEHVTMLIDEVEAHLHPKWQRTILRALLEVVDAIAPQAKVQLIVTTHAPLVLTSIEQLFQSETDAHFDFDLETVDSATGEPKQIPVVEKEPWRIRGDVNTWLASEIFDHTEVYSPEAAKALAEAKAALDDPSTTRKQARRAHKKLIHSLSELDPFLIRWRYLAEKRGWLP
ncbi:MAG TPA: ATP-binding protein [Polyangiaceae bacterium]|nr:ATP-binding protein [Polyangiaceae bacterium]